MEVKASYSFTIDYKWHSLLKSISYNNGVDSHFISLKYI